MVKRPAYRVLAAGIVSTPLAAVLGAFVYVTLTRASSDLNQDFVFRLAMVILAMTAPCLVTLGLAFAERRQRALTLSGKLGITLAVLSLGLIWVPARALVRRSEQAHSAAMRDVAAPVFDTVDILGKPHRLQEDRGKVVVINAWATWCPPCREEMPLLDELYRKRKDEGLMVYGLSTEDVELQRTFVRNSVQVSYPLLTLNGNVPTLYTDIQRWPAIFLVDRQGRLQPAPAAGQSFDKIEAAVNALLNQGRSRDGEF